VIFAETADGRKPPRIAEVLQALGVPGTPQPQWHFRLNESRETILQQFGVSTLAGFGIDDEDPLLIPAGVIIRYLRQTQALDATTGTAGGAGSGSKAVPARSLAHLRPPRQEFVTESLLLDATKR